MAVQERPRTGATRSALFGYAVLRANFDHNAPSYLDNFNAFVLDVLADRYPQAEDEAAIGEAIRATFGLTMPDGVVRRLLRKLVSAGKVLRADDGTHQIAEGARAGLVSLRSSMAEFLTRQSELIAKFTEFVHEHHPESVALIEADPASQLQAFIENHAAPLLRRGVDGQRDGAANWGDLQGAEYLVGALVLHLETRDSAAFGYLIDAVKGAILTGVLEMGPGDLRRSLDDLTLVLDTPVLLNALGYQGEIPQRATGQMLDLARRLSVKIVCFEHTEKELSGVLEAAITGLRGGARSTDGMRAVDVHFRDIGATPADVVIEQANLHENLQGLGLRVINRPDDYYRYGLDEDRLEALFKHELPTQRDQTRLYDIQSISAVHRLRRGGSPNSLERCRYLFVTDNHGLTLAAKQVDERHRWPLAMLDGQVASLLWVRSPAIADDLPRQQLMAAVYTGMQPPAHLWMKYVEEIERLESRGTIDPDVALILRSRPEARDALMDVTLGETERVSTEVVEAVVNRVREQLSAPYQAEAKDARSRRDEAEAAAAEARRSAADAKAEAARESQDARSHRERLEQQVGDLSARLEHLRHQGVDRDARIQRLAGRRARRVVGWTVVLVATILIVPLGMRTYAPKSLEHVPGVVTWTAAAASIMLFVLAALVLFVGGAVRDWMAPLEMRLASRIEKRLRSTAGLPPTS